MTGGWLRTNHWGDAVASLEAAQEFSSRVTLDEVYWKWALIAVHFAVQAFMVLALEQGNSLLALKNHVAEKWLKAHEAGGGAYPEERMDIFLSLYEKVKSDVVCRYAGSTRFVPEPRHDESMRKLNQLRNDFIHFLPKVWSIELAGLPQVCRDSLDVAGFLGWDSGAIIWSDAGLSRRAATAIAIVRATLTAIERVYDSCASPGLDQ